MEKDRKWMKSRKWVFPLFVIYIFSFLLWWTYLLYDKNESVYREKTNNLEYIKNAQSNENKDLLFDQTIRQMAKERNGQRWMIIGEGITFLSLMLLGVYRLRKAFKKELFLASQQKNFLLSITHELKSPIASALLQLQTIQKRTLQKDQQQLLLSNSEIDLKRLNALVEKMLLAAKMDNPKAQFTPGIIQLSEKFTQIFEQQKQLWQDKYQLSADIKPGLTIMGDEPLLSSLFINLLENAIKYSSPGSEVVANLYKQDNQIVLEVMDKGAGIPDKEKENIFLKFYRIGSEETRTTTGTGLGLFIVKQVALLHNGQVTVADNPGGGSIFKVVFG